MARQLREIVNDNEAFKVHANANFGDSTPRQVINNGVLKSSMGYSSGSTALAILREHGLVWAAGGSSPSLTKKGKEYLRAMFAGRLTEILPYSIGYDGI